MEIVKEYDRKDGCKVRLIADKGALSPREDECIAFGNLLTWGSRFRSPDENPYSDPDELLAELLVERLGLKGIVKGLVGKAYPGLRIMHRIYEDGGHAYALEALKPVQAGKQESWACWCDWDGGEFEQELSGEADYGYAEELADQVAGCRGTIHLLKQSGLAILPIYRFAHSGVAYSTTPFGDPWDSRLVGLAYADADDAVKTLGKEAKRLTRKGLELLLRNGVEEYSLWVNGDVYIMEVESPSGETESMGGIYVEPWDEESVLHYSESIVPLQHAA